jgi:hypothetical protein
MLIEYNTSRNTYLILTHLGDSILAMPHPLKLLRGVPSRALIQHGWTSRVVILELILIASIEYICEVVHLTPNDCPEISGLGVLLNLTPVVHLSGIDLLLVVLLVL